MGVGKEANVHHDVRVEGEAVLETEALDRYLHLCRAWATSKASDETLFELNGGR